MPVPPSFGNQECQHEFRSQEPYHRWCLTPELHNGTMSGLSVRHTLERAHEARHFEPNAPKPQVRPRSPNQDKPHTPKRTLLREGQADFNPRARSWRCQSLPSRNSFASLSDRGPKRPHKHNEDPNMVYSIWYMEYSTFWRNIKILQTMISGILVVLRLGTRMQDPHV